MEGAARALPSVCSGQQGKVDEVPEQRLVAGIRTANISRRSGRCALLSSALLPLVGHSDSRPCCTLGTCGTAKRAPSDRRVLREYHPLTIVLCDRSYPAGSEAYAVRGRVHWLYAAVHGSARALRTSHRLALDHQTAESMHRITRLNHSPHPAPALCSTQCAGARQRRSVRHSRVRERLAERHGLRQLKKL